MKGLVGGNQYLGLNQLSLPPSEVSRIVVLQVSVLQETVWAPSLYQEKRTGKNIPTPPSHKKKPFFFKRAVVVQTKLLLLTQEGLSGLMLLWEAPSQQPSFPTATQSSSRRIMRQCLYHLWHYVIPRKTWKLCRITLEIAWTLWLLAIPRATPYHFWFFSGSDEWYTRYHIFSCCWPWSPGLAWQPLSQAMMQHRYSDRLHSTSVFMHMLIHI